MLFRLYVKKPTFYFMRVTFPILSAFFDRIVFLAVRVKLTGLDLVIRYKETVNPVSLVVISTLYC